MKSVSKRWKQVLLFGGLLGMAVLAFGIYQFYKPHRNVLKARADYSLSAEELVLEFLTDEKAANVKYLSTNGRSAIVEVEGIIKMVTTDYDDALQIQLHAGKADVQVILSSKSIQSLKVGDTVIIKAVVRAGSSYDEDLEMYTPVILTEGSVLE